MPDDNLVNFLDNPHEEQVNAAIDADNAELVQVLLGPKYCQLWQYWLVHGIIVSKALNMERITNARLFLSIINKQEKGLEEQKKLLEERKKFLESSDKENVKNSSQENQLKKSRHFVRDLLIATRDAAVECRDDIVRESNQKVSYRGFYTPHNLLRNQDDNGTEDLEYVTQQISTISSAENLSLINEIDSVIIELNKEIDNDIWKQSDTSTKASYYLGKAADRIGEAIGGENGRTLDQAMNIIPENVNVEGRRVPLRAIANGIVAAIRYVPAGMLRLSEWTYDNDDSLSCVEGNLKEIERFVSKIGEKAVKIQDLSDKLIAARDDIESKVIEKMNDGKFIDKQFVKDMYRAFLYNYLESASEDPSNLLYHDIKRVNGDVSRIVERVSAISEEVDYKKFGGFLNRVLRKESPNFDVISVLIVNSSPLFSYNCTDQNANRNLKRLMRKSFQTVMIDVHNLLFDFDRHFPDIDVDVSLLSHLPNRDGSDKTRSCKNNIMLKGNKKYQAVLEEVKKFADEIDKLVEKGGLNRVRGYLGIPSLWYLICDFFQHLFSLKNKIQTKNVKL